MIFAISGNSFVNCSAAGGSGGGNNLTIRSSMFLYGNTLGMNSPGLGVKLQYPCYPFGILINDSSIFIGNREYQKGGWIGGHLFLNILYSSLSKVHGSTIMITDTHSDLWTAVPTKQSLPFVWFKCPMVGSPLLTG